MHEVKLKSIRILSYYNDNEIFEFLIKLADSKKNYQIVTLNSLIYLQALDDEELSRIIKESLVVPDSFGIILVLFLLCGVIVNPISGVKISNIVFSLSSKYGYGVYCLGAKDSVIDTAIKNIKKLCPGVNIVGWHDGYTIDENLILEIKQKRPKFLLVGLGSPKQEKWIDKNIKSLDGTICVGIGGVFDVLSGRLKRAPVLFRILGLEWLFRLYQEPHRIFRVLKLPVFLIRISFRRI